MDRINTDTKAVDLFGAGKHGWKNGNVGLGIVPTDFNADWFNGVQEELLSLIEGAGIVASAAVRTQVNKAVKRLAGGNVTTVNAANSPFVLTADHTGLVIMDATAGNASATLPAANALLTAPLNFRFVRREATANTATVTCAGVDTLIGGATSFTITGQADQRYLQSDSVALWLITSPLVVGYKNLASLTVTVAANAMTGTLAAETLDFRSVTLTSGAPVTRTAAAAVSLVVPSGATLGAVATVASRIVWGWLDNAGVMEPFVANLAGGVNLDETTLISTTAISAAADSANVIYSTTARASVAFRIRGFCDITEAVAGTWATAPTLVQPAGGQALAALSSFGFGQTWQDVSGSRAASITYYNTTGRPIQVLIQFGGNGTGSISVNGVIIPASYSPPSTSNACGSVIVPPGASYVANLTTGAWFELR